MPRPDYRAVCRLALEAILIEPQGIRRADVWSLTQASKRAGARIALRGALDEAEDPNLEEDIARFLRDEMSRCRCEVPRECAHCRVLDGFLVRLGFWSEVNAEVIPAAEPPVEGARTVPAARSLVAVEGGLGGHERSRS